jgi:hypothetical protein
MQRKYHNTARESPTFAQNNIRLLAAVDIAGVALGEKGFVELLDDDAVDGDDGKVLRDV